MASWLLSSQTLGKWCSSCVARRSIFFDADRTDKEWFFSSRCWPVLWAYSIWNFEEKKAFRKASGAAGTHFENLKQDWNPPSQHPCVVQSYSVGSAWIPWNKEFLRAIKAIFRGSKIYWRKTQIKREQAEAKLLPWKNETRQRPPCASPTELHAR